MNDLGLKIKILRKKHGLTQEQLAKKSGISKITLWNYENGKRVPAIDILEKIALALETTPVYLNSWDTKNINTGSMGNSVLNGKPSAAYIHTIGKEEYLDISDEDKRLIKSYNAFISFIKYTYPEFKLDKYSYETKEIYEKVKNFTEFKLIEIFDKNRED